MDIDVDESIAEHNHIAECAQNFTNRLINMAEEDDVEMMLESGEVCCFPLFRLLLI